MRTALARNWWAIALRGLLAILFGIGILIWPGLGLVVLVALFGAYALVDGIFAVISAVMHYHTNRNWWMTLIEGLAGIVIGILTFIWPGITAISLLYLIIAWAIITGIFEIIAAVRLRNEIDNEWWLALGGVLSILFGIVALLNPGAGALAIVTLIGVYAILFGITLIALGFRLRNYNTPAGQMSNTANPA